MIGGDWLGNVKLWDADAAKEVRTFAANPPSLAMRVEMARVRSAEKESAAIAAARALAALKKEMESHEKSHQAALATAKVLAAAKANLAQVPGDSAPAGVKVETIKAAVDSVATAAAAADAAAQKLAKQLAESRSQLEDKNQAAAAAAAASEKAKAALAAAEAEKRAFEEMPTKLTSAAESSTQAARNSDGASFPSRGRNRRGERRGHEKIRGQQIDRRQDRGASGRAIESPGRAEGRERSCRRQSRRPWPTPRPL